MRPCAILHFVADEEDPAGAVATLLGALPPGSYLVASHVTREHDPVGVHGLEQSYRPGEPEPRPKPAEVN